MSGHHVGDLASSFVEMAKAYEELPVVKRELSEARGQIEAATNTVQRLELKLIDRATKIDELHAHIRTLEVARDDAELRFLEADDKLGRVAKAIAVVNEVVRVAESVTVAEPYTAPPSDWDSTQGEPGSTSAAPSYAYADDGAISPEPFSPESKPTDLVEVREEPRPIDGATANEETSLAKPSSDMTTAGQSDPLPTAALPIDGSPAGSTNANPSVGASFPIDEVGYHNEPKDRWADSWYDWARKMDERYGRFTWPARAEVPTAFSNASHQS